MVHEFMVIDGNSLVHRAFYALPLSMVADGRHTNAVYGFTTMLLKLLADRQPDMVAVAFDRGRVTFRNQLYDQYKAHRQATPQELAEQFPLVHEVLEAFGIKVLTEAGFEADDIIGTLATKAVADGQEVVIVTGDRDALQLVGPHTKVLLTKKGITEMEAMDRLAVKTKYGIEPEQVVDLKGLMGDSSDNIPGVPGIGEKTAVKLISQFGTVESILAQISFVSGTKLRENLNTHAELALLSKRLATIICNMPIPFAREDFIACPNYNKIREVFVRLQFKRLLAALPDIPPGEAEDQEIALFSEEPDMPPLTVATTQGIDAIAEMVRQSGFLYFMPQLAGHVPDIKMAGVVVALTPEAVYIPATADGWQSVIALLADPTITKVTHGTKQVWNACRTAGIVLCGPLFDTFLAAYLLNPAATGYSPNELAGLYLGQPIVTATPTVSSNLTSLCRAAVCLRALHPLFVAKLAAEGLDTLYYEVELPLVAALSAMETAGISIDTSRLQTMTAELGARLETLIQIVYQLAGEEFNVNSPKQLGTILFDKLKLPIIKKTKSGYSTDAEVLDKLTGLHPLIDQLQEYRLLTKLKSTYLDGMPSIIHHQTGRIHTTFNQAVTTTGRLSSTDPNLQNIPIRTEVGRKIRELFVPGEDWQYIMSADYSQIELRVLAHLSDDPHLVDAFRSNQDIHTRTAAEVFGVAAEEVTPELRRRAKAVNFGIVYGISDYGLARNIGVSRKEAKEYIDLYFARYSGVKSYMDNMVEEARRQGYVTTLFGRRRYLPDIKSSNFNQRSFAERTAMNTPVQGSAADIIKKAMIDVYRLLVEGNLKSRILLQVHDELVVEVAEAEMDTVACLVQMAMEQAVVLTVPLLVDVKFGLNWAQAK